MSIFISDVFEGVDEIEPLSEVLDRQEESVLKYINPKNVKKAKKLISLYSVSNSPFYIFKKNHCTLESYKQEIENFLKKRELDLKKIVSGIK